MKKIVSGLLVSFMFLFFASYSLYAEPCGFAGNRGGMDIPGQGMPMIPPMMHHGMEMRDGMPGAGHFMVKRLMDLGLDEKQKEAIKEIISRVMKDTIRKSAEVEVARVELKDILDKDPVDMRAAEATLKKIESLMTGIHLLHIKEMEAIKAKLTPEQRKKFKEPPQRETAEKKSQKSN